MSQFEDELKQSAPGISQGSVTALEASYGSSAGFCAGLDIFTRIYLQNAVAKQIPAFGEPWRSIYLDVVKNVQSGALFTDAVQNALLASGRPSFALYEAVMKRKDELGKKAKTSGKMTMEDYQTELKVLGYDLKLNLCGMHIEVNGHKMTDYDDSEIRLRMEDAGYKTKQRITDAVLTSAKENEYHPIRNYLDGLKWDGTPRIKSLAGYFSAHYKGLFPDILRKWLIGAIARVFDGDQNPMLVLEGPQGIGKSTFAKWLCPDAQYYKESSIDPDNKDHRIATSEVWIWEVSELGSTTKKADREALKSFLTTNTFLERAAYGKFNQPYKAIASFIGTVNDESGILNDPTGARRFWIIGIDSIDMRYSQIMTPDQIWAEAMFLYRAGETHDLDITEKQTMEDIANEYRVINSVEEAIKKWFVITDYNEKHDPNTNDHNAFTDYITIRSVLIDPNKGNLSSRDASDVKIAAALKGLGLARERRYITQQSLGVNRTVRMRGYAGIKPL